jgi:phosphoesterase RecJ-like protein
MTATRTERIRRAAQAIRAADSILLGCHVRPDADALGSLLALLLGLEYLGKRARALSADGVPAAYRFLPCWERVQTTASGPWDLAIGLDCDGSDRLGAVEPLILAAPVVIDLDHHTGPDPFGHIQVVDPTAAATAELVFELLAELQVPVTREIAVNLLAALLTDTGSFRFTNVTPNVFRIAAELTAAGAHPAPIYEAVYGSRPYASSLLLGRLLSRVARSSDGRVVWAGLEDADFTELGADSSATEGFVDQLRMVQGAEVAVFFRAEPDGSVRVSLRSRGANVAQVAEQFGGGGHVPAAGCTVPGPLPEAVSRVIAAVEATLPSV